MTEQTAESTDLLRQSLTEAQATVRSYDTKAQIVGVGYMFALNVVFAFDRALPDTGPINHLDLVLAWLVVMSPILLFGYVLYPSRHSAPRLTTEPPKALQRVLYIDPDDHPDVEHMIAAARDADPEQETAYELLKVSKLREIKRERFLRALFASGICFFLLFFSQATRAFFGV